MPEDERVSLIGHATLVVENGHFLHHKFAIVERNGKISIIPAD